MELLGNWLLTWSMSLWFLKTLRWSQDHVQCHTCWQHIVNKVYLQPSYLNVYYSLDSSKTSYKTRDLGLEDLKIKILLNWTMKMLFCLFCIKNLNKDVSMVSHKTLVSKHLMVKELVLISNVQPSLRTVNIDMTGYLSRDHSKVYFQSVPIRQ